MDVKVDAVFPLNKQGVDDMSKYGDELNKEDPFCRIAKYPLSR